MVERARSGDPEAFAALATAAGPGLFATASLILRDQNRAAAAVQEGLLAAWRGVRALHDPDAWDQWLLHLVVRACFRQRKQRRGVFVVNVGLDRDPVHRAFRRLSLEDRSLVVLVHFAALPAADAADIVGINRAAARSRLDRALAALAHSALEEPLDPSGTPASADSPGFESALTEWLQGRAPDRAPSDLLAPVLAGAARTRPMPRCRALFVVRPMRARVGETAAVGSSNVRRARLLPVAGLLLAAASAAILAIGPRVPTEVAPPSQAPESAFGGGCNRSSLPNGLIAEVYGDDQLYSLASDGWFVVGPVARSLDATLTGRRMSPAGVQRYIDAIRQAHVSGWCRELSTSALSAALITTVDAHPIEVFLGHEWSMALRVLDPQEESVMTTLIRRLEHPEEWIHDDGWSAAQAQPYLPANYRVVVQFPGPTTPSSLRLPDGTRLNDLHLVMYADSTVGCSVLPRSQALALRDRLPPDEGGDPSQGQWSYRIDDDNSVQVEILALPASDDCESWARQFQSPDASPTPSPTAPGGFFACSLLPEARVDEILGGKYRLDEELGYGSSELGGELTCSFENASAGRGDGRRFTVSFRSQPTDRSDASGLARYLFGDVKPEDLPGGGRLWINGCFVPDHLCRPAMTISRAPYFALLAEWPEGELTQGQMRSLAVTLLDNMRDLPETWRPLASPAPPH
jgi:RNA polymerase sigma-70 factor (ECF subfamily)